MKIHKVEDADEVERYLGGSLSFWQAVKNGGIGSPRLVYLSGSLEMDEIAMRSLDTSYCNLHRYNEGLAIRLQKKNGSRIIGCRFDEIEQVHFETTPIRVVDRGRIIIRHKARLEFKLGEGSLEMSVLAPYYRSTRNFICRNIPAHLLVESTTATIDEFF